MRTSLIWRDCLIKELSIPEYWLNKSIKEHNPGRQDIFWVGCSKSEIHEQVLPLIKDPSHKDRIKEEINASKNDLHYFMVSRDGQYVNFWPYFPLDHTTNTTLWERFGEVAFNSLTSLPYLLLDEEI